MGNVFVGSGAGEFNTGQYNTFEGNNAGVNSSTGSSNIYLGNPGCTNPCTESNTIRIGTQGAGGGQQNTTYIAGVNGSSVSNGTPVYVDANGQLGTATQPTTVLSGAASSDIPSGYEGTFNVTCPTDHPHLVSGRCGFFGMTTVLSAPYAAAGPDFNDPTTTWHCEGYNADLSTHTLYYGALCSKSLPGALCCHAAQGSCFSQ